MSQEAPPSMRPTGLREARAELQDLFAVRPRVFWIDLLVSCAIGWGCFAASLVRPDLRVPALLLAALGLYRAVLFVHEISHSARAGVRGFEPVWNLLVGIPLLVPSFTYVGVHTDHHRRTVYGTAADPEYLPLGRPPRTQILRFLVEPLLIPLAFLARFVLVAPLGLLVPSLHSLLERRASSLAINLAYVRRDLAPEERRGMRRLEIAILVVWWSVLALCLAGLAPWTILLHWYAVSFGAGFVNQVRTLAAHRYRGDGEPMDVVGQLLDTVNVPGGPWTALWAPVGLRYHALHHYLPDMPYHSLAEAHRRLMRLLPEDAPYRQVNERQLLGALWRLWRSAARA